MKNVFSVLLVSIMLLFSSCTKDRITGSGTIKSEDRFIKNFTQVSMAGSTDVTVVKGAVFNVNVKGYSNLLPYFETNVVNGTLELGFDEHVRVIHSNIEVIVTVPVLNGLSMAGSGNIRSAGDFTGNNNFRVEIAGSGNINIEDGDALNFSASIFGSGNINAYGFTAEKAEVEIAGSGNTKLVATDKLNVDISGSGRVYYKGSPNIKVNIIGSGKLIQQ